MYSNSSYVTQNPETTTNPNVGKPLKNNRKQQQENWRALVRRAGEVHAATLGFAQGGLEIPRLAMLAGNYMATGFDENENHRQRVADKITDFWTLKNLLPFGGGEYADKVMKESPKATEFGNGAAQFAQILKGFGSGASRVRPANTATGGSRNVATTETMYPLSIPGIPNLQLSNAGRYGAASAGTGVVQTYQDDALALLASKARYAEQNRTQRLPRIGIRNQPANYGGYK